jgi:TPR repeat protein
MPPGQDVLALSRKAVSGDAKAMVVLADLHERGIGTPSNTGMAVSWNRRAALEGNEADGWANWGRLMEEGAQGTPGEPTPIECFEKAAKLGNSFAQRKHADYLTDQGLKLKESGSLLGKFNATICFSQAADLYKEAATAGDPIAQWRLGDLMGSSEPCRQAAYMWYQKAADQGNVTGRCKAAYCLEHGYGCPKDLWRAAQEYLIIARQGNEMAIDACIRLQEHLTPASFQAMLALNPNHPPPRRSSPG